MQNSQHFIRIGHVAYPGIPGCIFEAITESSKQEDDDEERVWRVQAYYDICDEMAGRTHDCHATLAETEVNGVV